VNFDKTRVLSVDLISDDFWTQRLRSLSVSSDDEVRQRSDINHYFDYALELARQHPADSVMKYALRRLSSVVIRKSNWTLFEAHLSRVAYAHLDTLQIISSILLTYEYYGYDLSRKNLSRLCHSIIVKGAPLNHHGEVSWSLWICRELGLKVSADVIARVAEVHSSPCLLLALDLERRKLTGRKVNRSRLKLLMRSEALEGDLWLFAYEAGVRGWIQPDDSFIAKHPRFAALRDLEIRFYDEDADSEPIFSPKEDVLLKLGLPSASALFDIPDVESHLDFSEPGAEYQDGSPEPEESETSEEPEPEPEF
jgi:hypothetical protein